VKKKVRWKRIAIVAGILFFIYVAIEIYLAGGGSLPPAPSTVPLVLHGGHVVTNHIATKSWYFDYEHAQLDQDGTSGSVDGVRNGVLFRKGKPYLRISAQHVQVDLEDLDFTAIGKVHVERIGGKEPYSFDTDLITWTNNAKLLNIDHPAYFHSGGQTLLVNGITVDFDANTIHFKKINGQFEVRR
jgi:hypothetical protein